MCYYYFRSKSSAKLGGRRGRQKQEEVLRDRGIWSRLVMSRGRIGVEPSVLWAALEISKEDK